MMDSLEVREVGETGSLMEASPEIRGADEVESLVDVDKMETAKDNLKPLMQMNSTATVTATETAAEDGTVNTTSLPSGTIPTTTAVDIRDEDVKQNGARSLEEITKAVEELSVGSSAVSVSKLVHEFKINIPDSLNSEECYFRWISTMGNVGLKRKELQTILDVVDEKFSRATADWEDESLKYSGIKIISNKACQAFCNILFEKYSAAKQQISEADGLVYQCQEQNVLCDEYVEGISYVTRALHMYLLHQLALEGDKDSMDELELLAPTSSPYEYLSTKAQVGVLAMKFFFGSHRRLRGDDQLHIVEEMIEKDDNYSWHYQSFCFLRIRRRDSGFGNNGPTQQEIDEITKAVKLNQEDPLVKLGVCQCLVDIFRNKRDYSDPWQEPISLGDYKTFYSAIELIDFIKDQTKSILKTYGNSVRVSVHLTDIFMSHLPFKYRDKKFAKVCIEKALERSPKSSKANHKMGLYFLTMEENTTEAIKYFKIAYEVDERNFPALADLIQTRLSNPHGNSAVIEELLNSELKNESLTATRKSNLYWFNGAFAFMKRNYAGAINNWIAAFRTDETALEFTFPRLSYYCNRYQWTGITLAEMDRIFKDELNAINDDVENKSVIRKLLEIVSKAIIQNQDRGGRGRGRGQYRGSSSNRARGGENNRGHGGTNYPGSNTGIFRNPREGSWRK